MTRIAVLLLVLLQISCKQGAERTDPAVVDASAAFVIDAALIDSFAGKSLDESLPRLTSLFPDITMEQAYDFQEQWVKPKLLRGAGIGGIKGGVVTESSMASFGVNEPICGILPQEGALSYRPGMVYEIDCHGTKLETEIGFVLEKPILEPIHDIDQFKEHLAGICAIIEIPCGTWDAPPGAPNPIDFAAINLLAHDYIIGPLSSVDTDAITFTFMKDGEILHTAKGSDCWKGPLQTAMHLANFGLEQGISLQEGNTIICGALGAVHDANPGQYELKAEGVMGVAFEVK